jgi:hypothetical protein
MRLASALLFERRLEDAVNRRRYGILAGIIGSALGAWWWTHRRATNRNRNLTPARDRGEVILDNTPV